MLNCREITDRASDYLDGDLSRGQRMGVHMHLLMCRHCRRLVRQLSRLRQTLARRPPPVSEEQYRRWRDAVLEDRGA